MNTKTIICASLLMIVSTTAASAAASCTKFEDSGKFKNKFLCPVSGGATVRRGDACAKEGGTFHAKRGTNHFHNALDLNADENTSVLATKPGRVAIATSGWGAMGNTIIIDHEDGDYSIYGHLDKIDVAVGDCIKAGAVIGSVGYTGNAVCLKDRNLSAHLHFAIIRAAAIGLANAGKPIATATKNAQDWLDLSKEIFPGDNLDLGIKDPEPILSNVSGCLK